MAPKKASQTAAAAAAATAADYFTKSKKPTTTDRTLTLQKSVTTTTATSPTSTTLLSTIPSSTFSNNSNKKFTTQQKRQALKRKGRQILQDAVIVILDNDKEDNEKENIDKSSVATTTAHAHVDISSDIEDEGIDNNNNTATIHARVDINHGDDRDPAVVEEDLGPLDDFLFDDSFELQRSQCSQGSQAHQPQNKPPMATTVMEPLSNAPLLRTSPDQRYRSHSKVTLVGIKSGIHQSGISEHEKMLCQFDLTSKYGPCLNITRLERWERALQLGLAPPMDIKDVLIKDATLNDSIFAGRV